MAATSAVYSIAKAVADNLQHEMQTIVDTNDPTRGGLVRIGLLQQSPITAGINILVEFNDIDDERSWRHGIVSADGPMIGIAQIPYEVGGGQMWWRRYTIKMELFFRTGTTRDDAENLAQVILSRAEVAIVNTNVDVTDDFGETPLKAYVVSSTNTEGGGTGQFIFHTVIWFQVLTDRVF